MPTDESQVEIWKKTVEVQQHFNDLELRIRNFALAVLGAFLAFGGSALKDGGFIVWGGQQMSVAGLLVLTSLIPLAAFYLMDRLWYHRLLYGAVKAGALQEAVLERAGYTVSLGNSISQESEIKMWGTGWPIRSTVKMDIFYAVLALTVLLLGTGLAFGLKPPAQVATPASATGITVRQGQSLLISDIGDSGSVRTAQPPPAARAPAR